MTDEWIATFQPAHNPKLGSAERSRPFTEDVNKGGIEVRGIIPRTDWHELFKVQGTNREKAVEAIRTKLRWIKENRIEGIRLSKDDKKEAQASRIRVAETHKKSIPLKIILDLGELLYDAAIKLGCPGLKIVETGSTVIEKGTRTLGAAIAEHIELLPASKKKPQRKGNNQAQTIRAILDCMAQEIGPDPNNPKVLGPDRSLLEVVRDAKCLKKWMNDRVVSAQKGWSKSYRKKARAVVRRFLEEACGMAHIPLPSETIYEGRIQGKDEDIVALPPSIIRNVLFRVLKNHPARLLFVLLQAFCGLRPEEAFQILPIARKCIVGRKYLLVPRTISKTGVQRMIRLRPAFLAWLNYVPGWKDGSRQSFIDQNSKGTDLDANDFQVYLNDQIRLWWDGRIPTESLRKSWISACATLGIPKKEFLILEAGHDDIGTLNDHYDAEWPPEQGLELFSIFPEPPEVMPSDFDLHHALDQKETDYEKKQTIQ